MRVLGVDFGDRRVGLALSDPTGVLASPLETLRRRRGKKPPLRALEELARADEAFFTGTTTEVKPCVEIDGRPVGKGVPGPVTTRLSEAFLARVDAFGARSAVPAD